MPEAANPARERILGRIQRALEKKTPAPTGEEGPLFAPIDNLLERFEAECKANITECIVSNDASETCGQLRLILSEITTGQVFAEDTPELRLLLNGVRDVRWSTDGPPLESSAATITSCEALVALTGSVVTSSARGGRGASIVAPVHVVMARESQLVADLDSALELVSARGLPAKSSFIGFITGCSRTGDIEKQLVVGAHGPLRLIVIIERHK
jgi:L-lactate dehydrogenase complex protein LldG